MKYKVGDRVFCAVDGGGDFSKQGPKVMDQGVVIDVAPARNWYDLLPYAVRFNRPICEPLCEPSYVWWCSEDGIEYVNESENVELSSRGLEDIL